MALKLPLQAYEVWARIGRSPRLSSDHALIADAPCLGKVIVGQDIGPSCTF